MKQFDGRLNDYQGAISGIIITPDIAEEVFSKWDYGHAFAYLWRRFGPPFDGSDPHKELCNYCLTTRMPGVLLYVSPKLSAEISFGYLLKQKLFRKLIINNLHDLWLWHKGKEARHSRKKRVENALRGAMQELKRPVNVRDWLINIEGRVEDGPQNVVEPSSYAGYGVTREYLENLKGGE